MNRLIAYTLGKVGDALRSANLENERSQISRRESEEDMSINKKKIRREIMLNGEKVWITADTEQEYIN